jgi:glycosyltransferase involved in cell wall biosynthesis
LKVLFVSSGNKLTGISNIVLYQGKSLQRIGVKVEYFLIEGHGIKGYLKAVKVLKKKLLDKYDLIHAHYSLSGFVAALAGAKPLIVSLMGSDVKEISLNRIGILFFNLFFWDQIIVKTDGMMNILGLSDLDVIPNGVDLTIFYPQDRIKAREKVEWNINKVHILFPSDPSRAEKNYKLFLEAIGLLKDESIEIHDLVNIKAELVPVYFNATNIVALTSLREGSPNVIKEAMGCNVPVVSTDVGDVKWIFGSTNGCYVTSFDAKDIADKLKQAILFSKTKGKTNGRDRIIKLGLSSETIAEKIKSVYQKYAGER